MYLSVNESLGFALTTTLNTLRKKFNSELKSLDITSEQYAVMKLVLEFASLMPSKIADMLSRDRANITRIVNSLEKKGFIKKEKLNEKSYVITLTDKGKKALEKAEKIVIDFNKRIKNIISEDDYNCLIEKLFLIRDNF